MLTLTKKLRTKWCTCLLASLISSLDSYDKTRRLRSWEYVAAVLDVVIHSYNFQLVVSDGCHVGMRTKFLYRCILRQFKAEKQTMIIKRRGAYRYAGHQVGNKNDNNNNDDGNNHVWWLWKGEHFS